MRRIDVSLCILLLHTVSTLRSAHGSDITYYSNENEVKAYPDGQESYSQAEDEDVTEFGNAGNRPSTSNKVNGSPQPPSIYRGPTEEIIFKRGSSFQLTCMATGNPPPKYRWTKNNKPYMRHQEDERVIRQKDGVGDLIFYSPYETDEGNYQCFAENELGVSVSAVSKVHMAFLSPFLKKPSKNHTAILGECYTLKCDAPQSRPNADISWAIDDGLTLTHLVTLPPHIFMDEENGLRFTNVQKEDDQEGKAYVCVATNNLMQSVAISHKQYLNIAGSEEERWEVEDLGPCMYASPSDIIALKESTVTLQCIFGETFPRDNIKWMGPNNTILGNGSTIELIYVGPKDAGMYRCLAWSPISMLRYDFKFHLRVESKPYFLKEPVDVEVDAGGHVEFDCEAGGIPAPDISWTINGLELNDPALKKKRFIHRSASVLAFSNVSDTDSSVIQCNATNTHGFQFIDFYLNVHYKGPKLFAPPKPHITSVEGHDVSLMCGSEGVPSPSTIWYKDNVNISGTRFIIDNNGTLNIKSTRLSDAGVYRCEVVNSFGSVSGQGTLTISASDPTKPPSIYLEPNRNVYYRPNGSFVLECRAYGNPLPTYRWVKNGVHLDIDRDERVERLSDSGTLLLTEVNRTHQGLYQCLAQNEFGVSVSIISHVQMAHLEAFHSEPPSTSIASEGDFEVHLCFPPLTGDPLNEVIWAREDDSECGYAEIDLDAVSPRITMDNSNQLQFANIIQEDDLGSKGYFCMVKSALLRYKMTSTIKYIDVKGHRKFVGTRPLSPARTHLYGLAGTRIRMKCIFFGNPTPRYAWEKEGSNYLPPQSRIVSHGQVLEIEDLQPDDAGIYRCTGKNSIPGKETMAELFFNLRVESRPFFIKELLDVDMAVGGHAEFNCDAGGVPAPVITWTINGLPLEESALKTKTFTRPSASVLVFDNLSKMNSMVIQCNASNVHGYKFQDVYLNVLSLPRRPPKIHTQPRRRVYFLRGGHLQLACEADGNPTPRYQWRKTPVGDLQEVEYWNDTNILVINELDHRAEGQYRCFAENELGVSTSDVIEVRMAYLNRFPLSHNKTHRVSVGESLTLTCNPPTSVPHHYSVEWFISYDGFGDHPIKRSGRVVMDHEYRLHFINIRKEDEQGNHGYYCTVSNVEVRSMTAGEKQYINVMPGDGRLLPAALMYASPSDMLGLAGTVVRMKCIFSGNPTPKHTWGKDGSNYLPPRSSIDRFGQVLKIYNLQPDDAGIYRCIGRNPVRGKADRVINLRVESRPFFIKELVDVDVAAGGHAEFDCEVGGVPAPDITWTINGFDLKDLKNKMFLQLSPFMLVFPNVRATDNMVIQCNASNVHGYQIGEAYLNVVGKIPELFAIPENKVTVMKGGEVNLPCQSEGKPKPNITWYKNNVHFSGYRFRVLRSGTLNIKNVKMEDSGVYRCEAVNMFGNVSGEGILEIRSSILPTLTVEPDREVYYKSGESFKLECKADGNPAPTYRWVKNGAHFDSSRKEGVDQLGGSGTLLFTEATDIHDGRYQCLAENEFGVSVSVISHVLMIVLQKLPIKPSVDHRILQGDYLTLTCRYPYFNDPFPQVTWAIGDDKGFVSRIIDLSTVSPRISMDGDYGLRFANVKPEDDLGNEGYFCMVTSPFLRSIHRDRTHFVRVNMSLPLLQRHTTLAYASPTDLIGVEGTHIKMQCIFSGNPTPETYWEKKNDTFSPRAWIHNHGQTLEITHLQPEDAGLYRCHGQTELIVFNDPEPEREFHLRVESRAHFLITPVNVDAVVGGNATFTCEAGGVPEPYISWSINGAPLEDPPLSGMTFTRPSATVLEFHDVSESDTSVIQCHVHNEHADQVTNAHLNILYPRNLRVTNLNLTSMAVTISWEGAVDVMAIGINDELGNNRTERITRHTTQHLIAGLEEARTYSVKIVLDSGFASDPVWFRVPLFMTTYQKLTTIVLRSGEGSLCLVPEALNGTYILLDAINDVSIELTVHHEPFISGYVVPRELILRGSRVTTRISLIRWDLPEHPDFDVTSTELYNLVLENDDVKVTLTRELTDGIVKNSLEILMKSQKKFSGMIEMLNEAITPRNVSQARYPWDQILPAARGWGRPAIPPASWTDRTSGECDQTNSDESRYLTSQEAWIYDTNRLHSGYH